MQLKLVNWIQDGSLRVSWRVRTDKSLPAPLVARDREGLIADKTKVRCFYNLRTDSNDD
jgi:hypothetical protein